MVYKFIHVYVCIADSRVSWELVDFVCVDFNVDVVVVYEHVCCCYA